MPRTPLPHSVALQDEILTILRDSPRPMSTMEVFDAVQAAHGAPHRVYPQLRALEQQHRIKSSRPRWSPSVWWEYVPPADDTMAEFAAIVASIRSEA